ncbi:helix-turn-helix domain-containing protein [Kribbella sp. CA-293567]|uniref:helix-turn-helix domain-containing protein n=1 Tax=Kribbella sp. CA-293567 TaxID=3002436 RepID=UPI0022DD7C05|nr:helix-turn-helix transcriptional regulator [Kribbella sp. CA-293567]WBQ03674.1 helix-turn-helix transcriptional regulator [Kribbella sp. CA-293567]
MGREEFSFPGRQAVLDASLRLQLVRAARCDDWAAGRPAQIEVQLFGQDELELRDWLHDRCSAAEELVAVTSTRHQTVESFVPSHRLNVELVEAGLRMTSFFDPSGGSSAVTDFIVSAEEMPYYVACGPIQMKLIDGERVLVEGPVTDDGQRGLMLIGGAEAVNAARQYLKAVRGTAIRAAELRHSEVELTARQHLIAHQLSEGCTDDQIAERLTLSVRTVRYEVSRLLEVLEVRTRFAAGVRYARRKPSAG